MEFMIIIILLIVLYLVEDCKLELKKSKEELAIIKTQCRLLLEKLEKKI